MKLGRESLYEYWERFKKLCANYLHHQIFELLSLQYFYEGLNNMEKSIINAASGGALGDMTPAEAKHLIEKMASNSQQFSTRNYNSIVIRGVHDVATDVDRKLESKLHELVNLMEDHPWSFMWDPSIGPWLRDWKRIESSQPIDILFVVKGY
uniref:Retrotransposon gag domain-containing protein n=1 Tax=Cajanus cajan TaxID=3821 RepID=A0A151QQ48_CAJCA|nr:hypothetical protein KK1_046902 [Cajanus cajan]